MFLLKKKQTKKPDACRVSLSEKITLFIQRFAHKRRYLEVGFVASLFIWLNARRISHHIRSAETAHSLVFGSIIYTFFKPGGDYGYFYLSGKRFVHHGTENNIRIGVGRFGNDSCRFVDLEHRKIVSTGNVKENTLCAIDRELQQR